MNIVMTETIVGAIKSATEILREKLEAEAAASTDVLVGLSDRAKKVRSVLVANSFAGHREAVWKIMEVLLEEKLPPSEDERDDLGDVPAFVLLVSEADSDGDLVIGISKGERDGDRDYKITKGYRYHDSMDEPTVMDMDYIARRRARVATDEEVDRFCAVWGAKEA